MILSGTPEPMSNAPAPDPGKHGAAAGEAGRPHSPDWTVEQGWERYTDAEHAIWKTLYERQTLLLQGRACEAFLEGLRALPMGPEAIPDFRRLSEVLMGRTGWQVVAVPGLLPDEVFFDHLANRRFPAGNFIRTADELDYLQEPDVFHDAFGHLPMLMNPVMAAFIQAYGAGGLRAKTLGVLRNLARVYWYTVEFGLVAEAGGLRIYGAGIASSFSESIFSLEDPSPNRIRFELERVMRTDYRIDDFQETYFVLDRMEDLLELDRIDFAPVYQRAKALPDLHPSGILPADRVLGRGSGAYHAARRAR
jgi:phenylalanine-4-hydroxylase